ncbi:Uu.00g101410.m01.CDS01 [Anthostomella pinea]|uniref:Uu.00g101410.m01.CDS01 n=1 Tax=Anthostomella pinea TaxID=933095 RepID=A0AAI8VD86_9PEZI|nr:Uu.00g101410.m01.CDS01 [Anthostomella pinea]
MPPIKSILFDCDNTLVLSEDIAFEGCAHLSNEILEKHGIATRYDGPTLMHEFVGLNFRGLMQRLQAKHGFTMAADEADAYVDRELGAICTNLSEKCQPCEGVDAVLEKLQQEGKYGMAIVSSSAMPRVQASIKKVAQDRYFPDGTVFSAASSLTPPSSKPDPAVYLFACTKLGVDPGACVAIEDSRSGATAAKNAGIPLMGYVGPYMSEGGKEKQEQMAKMLIEECGAITIMYHWSEFWDKLKEVETAA